MEFLKKNVHLPNTGPLTIIPFGCVHRDDPGFRERLFNECLKEIETTKNCLAVGMGDYANFLRTHARLHLKRYTEDTDSWRELDRLVEHSANDFIDKYLYRIKDKLLGLTEGNHYYQFSNGQTDTQYMCQKLGVPYLDNPAFIRLAIRVGADNTTTVLKILLHHGNWSAGAGTHGADVASLERKIRMGFSRFDIVLVGHTHRKWYMNMPELDITSRGGLKCIEIPRAIVRTGCFVASYDKCTPNYAQAKLLPPSELGYIKLEAHFNYHHDDIRVKYRGIS